MLTKSKIQFLLAIAMLLCLGVAEKSLAQPTNTICIKDGQKLAFLGDSITQFGWGAPSGYCRLVISGLEANGLKVTGIGAGISGHKSNQMLDRLDKDVIGKKPEWMTLSCGVNDVWHGATGVPLDKYKENITNIVEKAQAANISVIILTATMITENPADPNNQKLQGYNTFLKELAAQKKCLIADLNGDMLIALEQGEKAGKKRGTMLTRDGVHMNPLGDMLMATGVLKAMGLNDAQLARAREFWLDIPKAYSINSQCNITLRQYLSLDKMALKEGTALQPMLDAMLSKAVDEKLKADVNASGK